MLKVIISPAKKMNAADDFPVEVRVPRFLEETRALMEYLQGLTYEELKGIWKCNDAIAAQNVERLRGMNLTSRLTPAVMTYEGIQYQTMAPAVMEQDALDYLGKHLYILSGFYGILQAFDGVTPYRLEMQAKVDWMPDCVDGKQSGSAGDQGSAAGKRVTSLYDYWGDKLYRVLAEPGDVIVNLASKEYSKAIEPWLEPEVPMISCVFGELDEEHSDRIRVKATAAKMARGAMVRFMAQHQVTEPEQLKGFDELGYRYLENQSDEHTYVFGKNGIDKNGRKR